MLEEYNSRTNLTNRYGQHWHTELVERVAHGSHGSHSKFAEGMRRSRINVKKSRQNNDC